MMGFLVVFCPFNNLDGQGVDGWSSSDDELIPASIAYKMSTLDV